MQLWNQWWMLHTCELTGHVFRRWFNGLVSLSLLDWWGPDVAEMPLITCGLFGASSHKMMMWISMVFCFIIIIINYSLTCKEIASKAAKWLKRKTAYRKKKKMSEITFHASAFSVHWLRMDLLGDITGKGRWRFFYLFI